MAQIEPVLAQLNRAGIRYVVVGGLAVVLHGYARLTADIDMVIDLEPEPARKAIEALVALGLRPRVPVDPFDFANRELRESWVRDKGMQVFSLWDPTSPLRVVDIFASYPIPFEELWERAELVQLEATSVRIAAIADLGPPQADVWTTSGSRRHREAHRDRGAQKATHVRERTEPAGKAFDASWAAAERHVLEAALEATPAQRLAWLEEALALAYLAGALPRNDEADRLIPSQDS